MFTHCVVVLAACLQVISAFPQNVPEQCRGPPAGVKERPYDCCKVPSFFQPEDFEQCGFKKFKEGEGPRSQPGHHGPPDCTKQLCIMEKYGLAKDGEPDDDAVKAFIDKWAAENKDFKEVAEVAKETCIGKELPGPPHICKANKMVFCITHKLFSDCPVWEETDGCKTLKDHMEQCRPFFEKI